MIRIALANLRFPKTPEESVTLVQQAIQQAAERKADATVLEEGWSTIAKRRQTPTSL